MRQYLKERPKKAVDVFSNLYSATRARTVNPTYYDKECTTIAVSEDKFRSFESLFNIAKGYFPRLTEKGFLNKLKNTKAYLIGCSQINKVTVGHSSGESVFNSRDLSKRIVGNTDLDVVTEFKEKFK